MRRERLSGSAPRPAPGPKPTLPHPPRTEWERRGRAVPLGWGGGHGASGTRGGHLEIWGTRSQRAPALDQGAAVAGWMWETRVEAVVSGDSKMHGWVAGQIGGFIKMENIPTEFSVLAR